MKKAVLLLLSVVCLYGCGSLKVIPDPGAAGTVNSADNSITVSKDNVAVTAKNADVNMFSGNFEGTVSAFSIVIENNTENEIVFSSESFLLLDHDNRQYLPLAPEKVKEMLSRDTYYLIPYPYVGFYYLEDYEKSTSLNRFNAKQPYFYELYPQDIFTRALPAGSIIPKAKVAGLVYFRVDLNEKKLLKLVAFRKESPRSGSPDFVFPFKISK